MSTDLTIAVVFHNEREGLSQLMASLKSAHESERCTLLLIDNASTDGGSELAQSLVSDDFAEWKFFERQHKNLGQARAQAMSLARTEWVVFVSADCMVEKNWISFYLEELPRLSERVAVLGSAPCIQARSWVQRATNIITQTSFTGSHLTANNSAYRRSATVDSGNFSREFDQRYEDLELNLRLQLKGWKLVERIQPLAHRESTHGWISWCRTLFCRGRGHWKVFSQHPEHLSVPMWISLVFLPLLISLFIARPEPTATGYLTTVAITAFYLLRKSAKKLAELPGVFLLLLLTQLSYSSGSLLGFFDWLALPFKKMRHARLAWASQPPSKDFKVI